MEQSEVTKREVTLTTTEEGGSSSDTGGNWSTHPQLDLLPSSNQELMWSSGGGTAIAVGGASGAVNAGGAIAQSSPSYGPVASDYANMAAMSVRSPMTGLQETSQVQQMNVNAMRYQHYMQGQVASPSFMGSATVSQQKQQQSAYPIDPTGARPGSFPSQTQANSMASMAQSPAYDQSCMTQGAACMPQSGYSIMHQQQQQMMMSQGSAMQMQYRSQQTYSTMQQMRMYGQQQQRAMLLHQQQQLANSAQSQPAAIYENGAMYPYGIPTATQRTPGMPGMSAMGTGTMCASTQMQRQMMIANGGGMMMMSPNGACMPPHQSYPPRVRNPPSVSPAYPQGTTAVPGYPQGQSMMIRAGPPMLYSQLQHEMTRQQVVAYSNPNAIMRPDPSDPNLRCMPSSQPSFPNEAKMAIPVEIVLRQFCLDHNATTSDYGFTLTQERFDSLRKGELDLQLKCFQHGDKKQLQQYNVWPTMPNRSTESSVKIFINNVAVPITSLDRSLYVGRLCVVGLNKLVVSVASCVCSHSFIMQLVSRRPIEAVINEIFMQSQRFIQSPIVARDKLLKIIETDGSQSRIPLYYANGNCTQRLRIPARSVRCSHSTCFDLEAFLMANQDNSYFDCPFAQCKSVFTLGEIEVDQFVAQILSETMRMPNAYEICLEANGCWRLIDPLPVIYPSTATSQQPRQQQPHPSSQPQCTTSSQNDFIQSNPSNTTNNNTASLPFTNTTNNEQQQIPTRSTAHKRERDENNSAAENHSLKRIKSESFAANVTSQQQSRSPYDPSSVPAPPSGSWIQSPSGALPSVLSPYGPSTSTSPQLAQTASQQQHQQRCGPPSAPSKYGGPGTPATPSNAQNPPSIGPAIGTSPGSTGNALQTSVQQQGSVEAVSVSGSAPYTPASVGSISGSAHLNNVSSSVTSTGTCENSATTATPQTTGSAATTNNCLNELSSSLNIGQIDDFFDDLIFSDAKMSSAAEMQKYLNEDFLAGSGLAEINAALKCESDVSRTITDAQDWNDVAQVIAEQS